MNIRKVTLGEAVAIIAELAEGGKRHGPDSIDASVRVLVDETMSYEHALWIRDRVALSKEGFTGAAHLRATIRASLPQGRVAVTIRARNAILRQYDHADLVRGQVPAEEVCDLCHDGGRHAHPVWTQFRNNAYQLHDRYGTAAWMMAFDYAQSHDANGNRTVSREGNPMTEQDAADHDRAAPW